MSEKCKLYIIWSEDSKKKELIKNMSIVKDKFGFLLRCEIGPKREFSINEIPFTYKVGIGTNIKECRKNYRKLSDTFIIS